MSVYGMKSHVMVTPQNSYGTSLTNSQYAIPFISESLTHTIEPIQESGMYTRYAESPYHEGFHQVAGDVQMEAHPFMLGYFLKAAIGHTSSTSGSGSTVNVFKPRTSDFDNRAAGFPNTIEVFRGVGSAYVYYDLVADSISFNMAAGELLGCTTSFIGAGYTRKAAGTPTYNIEKPFIWDQFSGSFNGAAICDLMDVNITFNNNLEASHVLCGSKSPYRIKRSGFQTCEISGTIKYESHSYELQFEAQSEVPFVLNFAGQQAPNNLKFDFPAIRLLTYEATVSGPGMVEASFTAQALYSVTSATQLEITLTNTYNALNYGVALA